MSTLISCNFCGTKNRIPENKNAGLIKCGKCKRELSLAENEIADSSKMILNVRCTSCRTKNRISEDLLDSGAKCGKCHESLKTDGVMTDRVIQVTNVNFEEKIKNSPLPVLLYCWATYCPGCKPVSPVVDSLPKEVKGKFIVGKLNIEVNPDLASKLNILSVPWLFIFDNGEIRESMPGISDKHQLLLKMAHYI